jgi:hypothetical protein
MKSKFKEPDFSSGSIEFRIDAQEVCIYGTEAGLRKLAKLCIELANQKKPGHTHLEDYCFLTPASLIGTIAKFASP